MIAHHYGTSMKPRAEVAPGTYVKHDGRIFLASANVPGKGLYIFTVLEKTIIKSEEVEIFLDSDGNPLTH
ncbi:cell division protein FtsZ [Salmonella enterica subsp. enterica]